MHLFVQLFGPLLQLLLARGLGQVLGNNWALYIHILLASGTYRLLYQVLIKYDLSYL